MPWGTAQASDEETFASTQTTWRTIQQGAADAIITLEPRELVVIQEVWDFSATDDGEFQVLASADGGTTWDTLPILAHTIDRTVDLSNLSFVISGYERIKLQARMSGTTDTTATLTVNWRKDGVAA